MDDDKGKVRVDEQLKIKIGEAKNLIGRHNGTNGATGNRDVYCTIALDQEEICRTPTIERTLCPFFGEEFQFEIPRKFRYLSVYVWDRDRHLKQQDKPIGKIAIRREELHNYNHKDHWFPLRPVDDDSEVQGIANIEIILDDNNSTNIITNTNYFNTNGGSNVTTTSASSTITASSNNNSSSNNNASSNCNTLNSITNGKSNNSDSKENVQHHHSQQHQHQQQQQQQQQITTHNVLTALKNNRIGIRLVECLNLARKNGACDPYAIITANYTTKRKIQKRTKIKKKTVNPKFDEIIYFELTLNDSKNSSTHSSSISDHHHHHCSNNVYTIVPIDGADLCEIQVQFFHHDSAISMTDDIFLGEIKLPLRGKQQQQSIQKNAWYFLLPRASLQRPQNQHNSLGNQSNYNCSNQQPRSCATPPGTRLSCDNQLGSLRLNLNYIFDYVFPLQTYDQLLNLLVKNLNQIPIQISPIYILGELILNKTELAQPFVKLFAHKNLIVQIIKLLADYEISKLTDPTTIFRGNTLVSKMMDEAMRLYGLRYLHATLRPIIDDILMEKKPCEIDPTRVAKDKNVIDSNLQNLNSYVERVFEAITKSATKCPTILCQIFHDLRESAAKHFPHNKEVRYSVVSGFIFLRFFAPAILGPKLFDLTNEPLDAQTNRTLTLISKTIQSLGNLVSSRSAQQPCKEQYTGPLYKNFCTEKHIETVKHFLEVISTVGAGVQAIDIKSEPILLKEGMMTKRAQGRKRFGRRSFKQRYFRLTTQTLSYSKTKGKRPICDIPLSDIIDVQRVDDRSFKMQNIFQIIRKERPLYVQTANCVEEKEWVDLLCKICQNNAASMEQYHPSTYRNGVWLCCSEKDSTSQGCRTVGIKQFDMELASDPARNLQRLHTIIMSNLNNLEILAESNSLSTLSSSSSSNSVNSGGGSNYNSFVLSSEDLLQYRKTIQKLRESALNLDQIHRKYKTTLLRETKYGSREAPIGDDNYFHMIRLGCVGVGNNIIGIVGSGAAISTTATHTTASIGGGNLGGISGITSVYHHQVPSQHFDRSPNFFHRNHLRSSANERLSKS